MSKIHAVTGIKKHYESQMQQVLRSISKITTKRPDSPAPDILLYGNYKISTPATAVSETRAVFPALPCPDAKTLELMRVAKNPVVGSKLNVPA